MILKNHVHNVNVKPKDKTPGAKSYQITISLWDNIESGLFNYAPLHLHSEELA